MIKRLIDISVSFIGLLLLSPFLDLICLIIILDSKGEPFYISRRVGKEGLYFNMWKFRTMIENADRSGQYNTANNDKRLTRVGKFLKKYQIDEIPQLINVFLGDMSLVGWRPEIPKYAKLLKGNEWRILTVKCGMTDYACLWNFHEGELLANSDNTEKTYLEVIRPEKIRLQLKYVDEQSLWTDLKIAGLTFWKILKQ
jgi:lipopolysaccharide/colanic/teichoic acid biosynthesis glycosyltransferase